MTVAAELLDVAEIARLSGLDYVTALAEGCVAAPPMNDVIPFELVSVRKGEVRLRAERQARFHNPMGIVHGGWLMTLLDSAMGLAVLTTLGPGGMAPTHETAVKFFRPITVGSGPLLVTGRVLSRGRSTIACDGKAESADGNLHGTRNLYMHGCVSEGRRSGPRLNYEGRRGKHDQTLSGRLVGRAALYEWAAQDRRSGNSSLCP